MIVEARAKQKFNHIRGLLIGGQEEASKVFPSPDELNPSYFQEMDKRILATGYNGAPSGLAHCLEIGCLRELKQIPSGERHELCRGLHAEQNAIIQAAFHGIRIQGATLYCTNLPCVICTKMLINAGIREIIYESGYEDELARDMLMEAKIRLKQTPAK